ncbi:MAG TPA: branched-chain amino acid ABC transporter permease [Terriglobales bacterium]|nr:branched-chain amino acid ABC transporter permease [Terriglobales bacterium]
MDWLYPFLQAVLNGILTGALYALIAMGMALIFGVMRIVNFAHGAFLMLGMYATWVIFEYGHVNPYFGFLAAGALLFAIGMAVYAGLVRHVPVQAEFMIILLTLGVSLISVDTVLLVFGADYHQLNFALLGKNFRMGQISLNAPWLISFAIALLAAFALYFFVMRTMFGRAARAIAQNPYSAPLMGINIHRVQAVTFGIGAAAAGIAGGLLLPVFYLYPDVGHLFNLKSFLMVVMGGMGSIEGAAAAGLVLGVVESLTSLYWGNEWALVVDFVLFILVLSFKPSGIFGSQRA